MLDYHLHHHHHHHHLHLSSLVSHSWGWTWYELPPLFLSSAISSVMFNFLMSSSTTLLQVFYGLPTGLLYLHFQLHRSPKYAILIPTFYILTKLPQPRFFKSMFKVLHSTPSSDLFIGNLSTLCPFKGCWGLRAILLFSRPGHKALEWQKSAIPSRQHLQGSRDWFFFRVWSLSYTTVGFPQGSGGFWSGFPSTSRISSTTEEPHQS